MGNKYYYSFSFTNEDYKSQYDIRLNYYTWSDGIVRPPEYKFNNSFDKFNSELAYLLVGKIFESGNPLFDIKACLNYHCVNSALNRKDFIRFTKFHYLDALNKEELSLVDEMINKEVMEWFNYDSEPEQTETKTDKLKAETEQKVIEMKPVLKPEIVQTVFDFIKDFFNTEQQNELKQVIETGSIASEKMLFKSNGNRLTDTFKKLIEHDFITGCQKTDLINWIISNFTFIHQKKEKAFIYDTVEKTISRNDNPCKSPLIEIEGGQIQKWKQPRIKKYNKY